MGSKVSSRFSIEDWLLLVILPASGLGFLIFAIVNFANSSKAESNSGSWAALGLLGGAIVWLIVTGGLTLIMAAYRGPQSGTEQTNDSAI